MNTELQDDLSELLEWFLDQVRASNPDGKPFATPPDPEDFDDKYGNPGRLH